MYVDQFVTESNPTHILNDPTQPDLFVFSVFTLFFLLFYRFTVASFVVTVK